MARAPDLDRAYETASTACLGNGFIHPQRDSFHAHRSSIAASHPGASSGFCTLHSKAGGADSFADRTGSFCLDLRRDLLAALIQQNVSPQEPHSLATHCADTMDRNAR